MPRHLLRFAACLLLVPSTVFGIDPPAKQPPPKSYVVYRTVGSIAIDGKLDDESWQRVPWTSNFVDIEGAAKPLPRFNTQAKMLWDDTYFYIAARMEEPHVWGTIAKHDEVIFRDNDFEFFIDPDGDNHEYYECCK